MFSNIEFIIYRSRTIQLCFKRKQWSIESMTVAVKGIDGRDGLREAAPLYNLPVETLRRNNK